MFTDLLTGEGNGGEDPKPNETKCPENPEECKGGYCVFGKDTKVKSCNITSVQKVSGGKACDLVTPEAICSQLKKLIKKQNEKTPGKPWGLNYCFGDCECDQSNLKWKSSPETVVFENDVIKYEYSSWFDPCEFKITGKIVIDGGLIAITPCKAKKKE